LFKLIEVFILGYVILSFVGTFYDISAGSFLQQ